MDFFAAQDRARRNTALLVVYFCVAVVLMVVAIYLTVLAIFALTLDKSHASGSIDWIQPRLFLIVVGATMLTIIVGSLYKTAELRSGGSAVALMLGGRRIQPTTTDLDERRVLNVVEEMAIAAGVAVPPVYLMRKEKSINAFAAGYTIDDAVIGVSQGTLEHLSRDELQGVIAHEFSHILNGDMRFSIRLIGILHGILLISIIGFHLIRMQGMGVRTSRDKSGSGWQVAMIGVAALVVGYVGLFFGRLIKAAVSRQREYLADASAVQFTRNPDSISGALKKIGGLSSHSLIESPNAETASHLFFGDAFQRWAHSPFATHPPLAQRIRRIDPSFDGAYPTVMKRTPADSDAVKVKPTSHARMATPMAGLGLQAGDRLPLDPFVLIASVGVPTTQHVDHSRRLLESIPQPLQEAIREAFSARAFVFALLLDADGATRAKQLEIVAAREGEPARQETERLARHAEALPATARLPALEVVQGTLPAQSPEQYAMFRETVDQLVKADRRISLFEFVFQRVVIRHLDRVFKLTRPPTVRFYSIKAVTADAQVLISALAHLGHSDLQEARRAFRESMNLIDPQASGLLEKTECQLNKIDAALNRLTLSTGPIKKRVLTAAAVCVAADRRVTVREAELFRAIASSIDCPIPPIIAGELSKPAASPEASVS